MGSAGALPVHDVFGVLAHPARREIIVQLAAGEKAVKDIVPAVPITRPAVSQHLRVMRELGIVSQESVGRENLYRLRPEGLVELRDWLGELDAAWASALDRLALHLEQTR
jgi:DNA-binding transcriptional ArsR family regulator